MNKKLKTLFWISSALIANTSVASALTSCSFKETINDIGNLDKQYGISMATYSRMESDFSDLYEAKEMEELNNGAISEQQYKANLLNFKSRLNSFHATLFNKDNKSLSYTIKTNALKDFAKEDFGIKLSRVTNINLNNELAQLKNSMMSSLLVHIKQYNIDANKAEIMLNNAETRFEEFKQNAIKNLGDNDTISIIQKVQSDLIKCFADICEEIDAIITQKQLNDFLNTYTISVKENLSENYYWNNLYATYRSNKKEINANDFNNIFTISSKSGLNDGKSLQKDFTNDIIPGYTLKPIMYLMDGDSYENKYSINVDFTLVKNSYIDNNDVAKLTTHSARLKDYNMYKKYMNDEISMFDINENEGERECIGTSYTLPITKQFEDQQFLNTYIFNDDFEFAWSNDEKYGIDNFWTEVPNSEGRLNKFALADTGMMINGYLLSDLIDKVDAEEVDQLPDQEQKAIKFVENADFNLDYVENGREILVNDFNFKYANSKSIFIDDDFDATIYKAINEESTVTQHTSTTLWNNIKNHYDEANQTFENIDKALEETKKIANEVNKLDIIEYILVSLVSTLVLVLATVACIGAFLDFKKMYNNNVPSRLIVATICVLIVLSSVPIAFMSIVSYFFYDTNAELQNALTTIKNCDFNKSNFVKHIKNDNKYFYTSEGKPSSEIFDSLSDDEKRNLKNYYCTYKNNELDQSKKSQSQKDYEDLLNINNSIEIVKNSMGEFDKIVNIIEIVVTSLAIILVHIAACKVTGWFGKYDAIVMLAYTTCCGIITVFPSVIAICYKL